MGKDRVKLEPTVVGGLKRLTCYDIYVIMIGSGLACRVLHHGAR